MAGAVHLRLKPTFIHFGERLAMIYGKRVRYVLVG